MNKTTARRGVLALAAGAAAAGAMAIPASASAATAATSSASSSASGYVQVGPGLGLQCVGGFASSYAQAYGVVTQGPGANFQLRFYGSQVAGSGAQVSSFSTYVRPGLPGWRGPGWYDFCARNNGAYATAYLDLATG